MDNEFLHKGQQERARIAQNIYGSYNAAPIEKSEQSSIQDSNELEKGRKANIGETREWGGKKYIKTDKGWRLAPKGSKVDPNKQKQVEQKISEHKEKKSSNSSTHPVIDKIFEKYPDNATSWAQADDAIRDMARTAKEYYNELDLDLTSKEVEEGKGLQPLNFRELKTPSEWNIQGKKYIREAYSKMSDSTKKAYIENFSHWASE